MDKARKSVRPEALEGQRGPLAQAVQSHPPLKAKLGHRPGSPRLSQSPAPHTVNFDLRSRRVRTFRACILRALVNPVLSRYLSPQEGERLMAIPTYRDVDVALLLELVRAGRGISPAEAYRPVARHFPDLTEADMALTRPNGRTK